MVTEQQPLPRVVALNHHHLDRQELIPDAVTIRGVARVEFVGGGQSRELESADGVVIPSGFFEQIQSAPMVTGFGERTEVSWDRNRLLEWERGVLNLLERGGWVCFLCGEIIDEVPQRRQIQRIGHTDLCKRFLNLHDIRRRRVHAHAGIRATDNEFVVFTRSFGAAKTEFFISRSAGHRPVVRGGNAVYGVECDNSTFFLPCHIAEVGCESYRDAVEMAVKATADYRDKRKRTVPEWCDEFRFREEERIAGELDQAREATQRLEAEHRFWRNYKLILSTAGDVLKDAVVRVLSDFFGLHVDPADVGIEDARIVDNDGETLAFVETKGTKRGVKRENVNQADSQRERNGLKSATPAILIMNNEMTVGEIEGRLSTTVDPDHVRRAASSNVVIVRTIDLLFLMYHLEEATDRKEQFLQLVRSGGGWLRADRDGFDVRKE